MGFNNGDIVKVKKQGLFSTGRIGVVTRVTRDKVDVEFETGGTLSYSPSSLMFTGTSSECNTFGFNNKKGDNTMLMGSYNVAQVQFIEGTNTAKSYYYALYDNDIVSGDCVVVKSASHGMGVAKVYEIYCDTFITQEMRNSCNAGREIISKFDMSAYETRKNNREQAKKLKADMEKKIQEVQELALFELMAEKSPELKEMLEKYKELTK